MALRRRPAGAGVKPPCAALAEDRRGERQGKRCGSTASGGDQEDVPEAPERGDTGRASLSKRRYNNSDTEIGDLCPFPGMSLAGARLRPGAWPGGVRRRGGVSLVLSILHGT